MRILGLDVGAKRIGVAKADSSVRIAIPVSAIPVNGAELSRINFFIKQQNIDIVVVGMPRNLNGEETQQSAAIREFVKKLNKTLLSSRPNNKTIKIFLQDESLTSVEAKNNLKNKKGGIDKKAGDIDTEAATLILQDFLENLDRRIHGSTPVHSQTTTKESSIKETAPQKTNLIDKPDIDAQKTDSNVSAQSASSKTKLKKNDSLNTQFAPYQKTRAKKWAAIRVLIIMFGLVALGGVISKIIYNQLLAAVVSPEFCANAVSDNDLKTCQLKDVTIEEGDSVGEIASSLKTAGLIKSPLAFKIHNHFAHTTTKLQAGTYRFPPTLSASEITDKLVEGPGSEVVFRFTALPGETIAEIKKRLIETGYSEAEVTAALEKKYDHPVLKTKPDDASLEGYLFGETYEFYASDPVEKVIIRMLDELYSVVQKNNLETKFNNLGLTLHEGIILASIVQKEAGTLDKDDQKTVAQIFLSRLELGTPLGSDVTVKYALDLEDPERKTYTDNAAALSIDSCYNTRKNAGLPCGPISNPGALVLISTANPSDTSYLYFLTGDDGKMYYSNTESEHLSNMSHCSKLCNTQL